MFDFGAGELLVIGIVALVVIGPKELPGVLRQVGKATGKMRQMAGEFRSQFDEAMREAELHEATKHLAGFKDDIVSTVTQLNPVTDIKNEIHSTTAMLNAPLAQPEPVLPVAAPAEEPAKPKRARKTAGKKIGVGPGIGAEDVAPPAEKRARPRKQAIDPVVAVAAEPEKPTSPRQARKRGKTVAALEPVEPRRAPAKLALVQAPGPEAKPVARKPAKPAKSAAINAATAEIVALDTPPKAS